MSGYIGYLSTLILCGFIWLSHGSRNGRPVPLERLINLHVEAPAIVPEGTPIFLQEPEPNYYIVKGRPITITCKASPASAINIRCGGVWYDSKRTVTDERRDPKTGVTYMQTSVEVTRTDVVEFFGSDGYKCECHAINNIEETLEQLTATSRKGLVEEAYIRKNFPQEPISTAVELESYGLLQCRPPKGVPDPEVFWEKDGVVLDVYNEINYIISSEGNLIISQTTQANAGNYTCGAYNIANRRLSESATVTVYVNGKWTSWGPWTDCNTRCGKGFQRRERSCTNPRPMYGGDVCPGEAVQKVPCSSVCPAGMEPSKNRKSPGGQVSGMWSTWSSWSTCAPDCKHHRRRLCDNPKPQNGGPHCQGSDLDTSNCTTGMCEDPIGEWPRGKEVGMVGEDSIAMYVGLIVAIGVFVTIVIIIVTLLRRRSSNNAKTKKNGIIIGNDDKKPNKGTGEMISAQPDLTQTVVTIQNHGAMDTPNNNDIRTLEKATPAYADNALNAQKALLLDSSTNSSSKGNTNLGKGGGDLTDAESRPNSLYSELGPSRNSALSSCPQLPGNIDVEAMVWAMVTPAGGRITLPDSGVSVTIPEAAIKKGTTEEMFIAVCRDDKDRPKLTDHQTVLGPVVLVGPPGLPLKKPVIISFQHCASIKHGQWALSVYGSDSSYDEHPQWQMLATLGQETINTPIYTQVDLNTCHIMTDHMLRYVMVGEPNMAGKAVKILRLAAFAPAVPSGIDYNVRVYFVEDTQDALESVLQVERKLGGRLLDKPKQILFQCGGGNLCLAMEELGAGWRCKLAANYQEIPFGHIWSGTQNGLHCSFALEHHDRSQQRLCCTVHVFQKNLVDNRQALEITCNLTEKLPASPAHMVPKSLSTPQRSSSVTTAHAGTPTVILDPPHNVFRLPVHIKHKLCQILDPPNTRGNDWRMLAQRLSVDRYINFFATKRSPTEHILDLWEARHRDKSAVTELMNSLRVMGRMDATAVLEKECGAWL